jgi:hypothetical protein
MVSEVDDAKVPGMSDVSAWRMESGGFGEECGGSYFTRSNRAKKSCL